MWKYIELISKAKIIPSIGLIHGMFLFFSPINPLYSQTKQLPNLIKPNGSIMSSIDQTEGLMPSANDVKEVFSKIQSHKSGIEGLREEVKLAKTLQLDSIQYDSMVQELKIKVLEQSESQTDMLTELSTKVDDEGLKNSISHVKSTMEMSSQRLNGKIDLKSIEDFIDFNEENLMALVDEHLVTLTSEPLEAHLVPLDSKEKTGVAESFYKNGIDEYLGKLKGETETIRDLNKEEVPWKIFENGKEKLGTELGGSGPNGTRLSMNEIKKKGEGLKLFGEGSNPYKGKPFFSRTNFGIYYDALQSIADGIHIQGHFGWRVSNHVMSYGGLIIKNQWKEDKDNNREGYGYQGGVRLNFGSWFGQAGIERTFSSNSFNGTMVKEEFEGWSLYPIFSGGRQVTITKSLKTVFLGYVDPLYTKNKINRLHSHMFGLKIGIELN